MRTVWRITTALLAATVFSREGADLYRGRWNPKGFVLVYTAESRAMALLEMMMQDAPWRVRYVLIQAQLPDMLGETLVELADLAPDWRGLERRAALQSIGRDWLERGRSAVLAVPSAVVPAERNYLLNPAHLDFARITMGKPKAMDTDFRLMGHASAGQGSDAAGSPAPPSSHRRSGAILPKRY
ncbi:RES domain-containing protein [Polaromonas sp.]|uniref:RES family NAD+ phosphorylase n=1 Tax=Polaromonas sp. TaxID=1869339 RepID=UPI0013B92FCD|nr:RES domain-containing protein [Polaromonas sp.]NDP64707.1 RES domain-containing protein [Polaromonas sp.]